MGAGLDGDSGWGKVWRAAAWAQLGDRDAFYAELKVRTLPPHQFRISLIKISLHWRGTTPITFSVLTTLSNRMQSFSLMLTVPILPLFLCVFYQFDDRD